MGAVFARQGVRSFLMTDGDGQWRGRLYRFVWKCKSLIMECFDKVNVADIADVFDRASGFWVLGSGHEHMLTIHMLLVISTQTICCSLSSSRTVPACRGSIQSLRQKRATK
jgi:hypothetical protein